MSSKRTQDQDIFAVFNDAYQDEGNPSTSSSPSPSSFHLFSSLPPELRLRVWNYSLEQQTRLVTVSLSTNDVRRRHETNHDIPYNTTALHDEPSSGEPYHVTLEDRPYFSPLLWVNSESRGAALSHYRVRIPTRSGEQGPQLYLNPDRDYLYIRSFESPAQMARLLNDLKAHDPRGIGIQYLAVYSEAVRTMQPLNVDDTNSSASICLRQTLLSLKRLWFVHLLGDHTRVMAGPLSGIPGNYQFGLNRSVPIFPKTSSLSSSHFTLLGPDPRPIEQDMKKLTVGFNPRSAADRWEEMEKSIRLGVDKESSSSSSSPPPGREISYVLSVCATEGYRLSTTATVQGRKSLDRYLRKEKDDWVVWAQKMGAQGDTNVSQVSSAAGFWLFPADAFDHLPRDMRDKHSIDMRERRPTLGLFTF